MIRRELTSVVLALSVIGNVWLGRFAFEEHAKLTALMARPRLSVGMRLPNVVLFDSANKPVRLVFSDAAVPTIIYVMAPTCGWCEVNKHSVRTLATVLGSSYRFVGIAINVPTPFDLVTYAASLGFPFPVLNGPRVDREIPVVATPTTILVSQDGLVVAFWDGAYVGPIRNSIEQEFTVALPEVVPPPKNAP